MNEKMLRTMVDAAAVKRARIIANGSRFHVEVDAPGRSFTVETGKPNTLAASKARWVSPLQRHTPSMIDVGSIQGLLDHDYELHAYCMKCDRWAVLNLAPMIAAGRAAQRLPLRVTCRDCGAAGQLQVRPPAPTRSGSIGWIQIAAT